MREHLRLIAAQEEGEGAGAGPVGAEGGEASGARGNSCSNLIVEDDEEWSEGEEEEEEEVLDMVVEGSS